MDQDAAYLLQQAEEEAWEAAEAGAAAELAEASLAAVSQAEARLESGGARKQLNTLITEARFVRGEPETALPQIIADEEFDLLVMGAYGHSRIRSLMIGSTTTQMIRSCKVPVVLYR